MAQDGVDVSIVYPNNAIFVYIEPDRDLALACMRSYNDWVLDEFQGAAPDHIVGLPMLPVDDGIDVCIAELDRCLEKGARGGFIPGFPVRPYHDPYYDALYAHAAEANVPLSFHRTFGGKPSEADYDELVEQKITAAGTAYRFFSAVRPFTYMVMGGVFDRHPELRIVAAEVNCGWLPFWAQTMEQNLDIRASSTTRPRAPRCRPPSGSAAISSSPCSTTTSATGSWPTTRGSSTRRLLHRLPAQRHAVAELARDHPEAHRRPASGRDPEGAGRQRGATVRCLTARPSSPSPT